MFWKTEKKNYPGYPQLPGTLRVGAILTIEPGETLRYDGLDLALPLPTGEMVAEAVSCFELFNMTISRAYVKTGERQAMFQFHQDKTGALTDVNCFQVLQEIFPAGENDWDAWLGEGGLVGGADLTSPSGKVYARDWGDGAYAAPVEVAEKVFTAADQPPLDVSHKMMLYSREIGEAQEFLLVSADEEPGQALVRILAGVVMSPQALKVY